MTTDAQAQFYIGQLKVVPSHNEIWFAEHSRQLQPQVMAVLLYLANHYPRVISSEELLDEVWKGRVVTLSSVQKSMTFLRKAIAELDSDVTYIAHYSKKGYQLAIAPDFSGRRSKTAVWHRLGHGVRTHWWQGALMLALLAAFILWQQYRHVSVWDRDHTTEFTSVQAITSDARSELAAEPHPDNTHLAMVRQDNGVSDLLVFNTTRNVGWPVASSGGRWTSLAWSDNGRYLAAVEREPVNRSSPEGFYGQRDYRESLHVFELSLADRQLLNKHRLSHWHGEIRSLTWWRPSAVEFVARHGSSDIGQRYRYHLPEQRLERISELEFAQNPLASAVHGAYTAVVNRRDGKVAVHLLDDQNRRFQSFSLHARDISLDWVPNGSGVLLADNHNQRWYLLYRNGEKVEITLDRRADTRVLHPRYSADGQRIVFVKERPVQPLWWHRPAGGEQALVDQANWNYGARFGPGGERLMYVSVRNEQHQLWLRTHNSGERQVGAADQAVDQLLWSADGESVLYTAGGALYRLNVSTGQARRLQSLDDTFSLVAFDASGERLVVKRTLGGVANIGLLEVEQRQYTPLTFGSVAGVVTSARAGQYFQYVDQPGLWHLAPAAAEPVSVNATVPPNSELVYGDEQHLYYLTGSHCAERALYKVALSGDQPPNRVMAVEKGQQTLAYYPGRGRVFRRCQTVQSDILMME